MRVLTSNISKLGVRPLVPHSPYTGQVSEGNIGWREHSLELIAGHVAVEQVVSERGLLVEPWGGKYFRMRIVKLFQNERRRNISLLVTYGHRPLLGQKILINIF